MSENLCDKLVYPSDVVTKTVSDILGDRCVDSFIMIPTIFIYTVIFILGLFGNVFTCLVIAKNKSMHSPTNYYLFSLAISDLLMLIFGKFLLISKVMNEISYDQQIYAKARATTTKSSNFLNVALLKFLRNKTFVCLSKT